MMSTPSSARARLAPWAGFRARVSSRRRAAPRAAAARVVVVVVSAAASSSSSSSSPPGTLRVTVSGKSSEHAPGVVVGSALVPGFDGVEVEHAKLEVRQGRVFVTSVAKSEGTFLGGSRLFPGVSYAVPEGATIALGEEGAAFEVEQCDGGAGTGGVDAMSQMMALQFEATASAEVKEALRGGE